MLIMKQLYFSVLSMLLFLPLFVSPQESSKITKIALNNWESQVVLSHVTGKLLSEHGIPVEYVKVKVDNQWVAFSKGLIDVQIEIWEGTMKESFDNAIIKGYLVDAGSHDAISREDWWYPNYVQADCPNLPNWQTLNDCKAIFSETNNSQKGTYYTGPWEHHEGAKIRALNLEFKIKHLKDSNELWEQIIKAANNKQPILIFNWTPNWTDVRMPGNFIEFPEYTEDCEITPSRGINKYLTYDCGNPRNGWIKKGISYQLINSQPCAAKIIKRINFSSEMIGEASALIIVDKLSIADAVNQWILKFNKSWTSWHIQYCITKMN